MGGGGVLYGGLKMEMPFYADGKFLDWGTGNEYFDSGKFAGPYNGLVWVQGDVFETGIDDNGNRSWKYVRRG